MSVIRPDEGFEGIAGSQVYQFELEHDWAEVQDIPVLPVSDVSAWVRANGGRDGQRFLIGPDGYPDLRVNAFFASAKMRNCSELTNRDYARCVCVWLNFLTTRDLRWWEAGEDDVEEYQFWRMTDPANDGTVQAATFSKDLAACKMFYKWAARRYGVSDPFVDVDPPRARRQASVKWLDPDGYSRWRDVGLRGLDLTGREDPTWRGRNEQRDRAFADGLYGIGLRLSEWYSVALSELPVNRPGRAYYTCVLADKCAKGGYGHRYWMPRTAPSAVRAYVEGPRAHAVRRAQAAGRYEAVRGKRIVAVEESRTALREFDRGGRLRVVSLNNLSPSVRRKLFVETAQGLEPLAVCVGGRGGEQGEGEHAQQGPPVPGFPGADLVLIEAYQCFGVLEVRFDAPPAPGHPGEGAQSW